MYTIIMIILWIISVAITAIISLAILGRYVEKKWSMVEEVPPQPIDEVRPSDVAKVYDMMEHIAQERKKIEKQINKK